MYPETLQVLTNIPAPYRTSFFNTLSDELEKRRLRLHVTYMAASEPNRLWTYDPKEHHYRHSILSGFHLDITGKYFHVNPGILTELREVDPRWLLVGGAWHLPSTLVVALGRVARRSSKILWTEGHADAVLNRGGPVAIARRAIYRRFDAFATPNQRSADFALEQAQHKVPTLPLPNTVNEDFFRRPSSDPRNTERERLGVPHDARVLLTVCQLVDRKSVVELALAFRKLHPSGSHPGILAFLGDGSRKADLERIAGTAGFGEIRVLGHLPQEQVRSWLWAADGFALPTRNDPNPLSPIEAAFAALPLIISSKAGNVNELVFDGMTGWRLDSLDVDSICSGLNPFFSASRETLVQMGREAATIAENSFQRQSVAVKFVSSILEHFPTGPRSMRR